MRALSGDLAALPEALRAALAERGMSQAALAEALGVHRNAVYEWCRGTKFPRAKHIRRIVEILDGGG